MKKPSQVRAKNTGAAQSKQARKSTGLAQPETPNNGAAASRPEVDDATLRRWRRENAPAEKLFARLQQMQPPTVICRYEHVRLFADEEDMDMRVRLFFSRDEHGRELFFLEEAIRPRREERWVKAISRKTAFALIVLNAMPDCLRDYMMKVLKKVVAGESKCT